MAHHPPPTNEDNETHPHNRHSQEGEKNWVTFLVNLLEGGDSLIYTIVGACFFIGALFALGYSFWDFYRSIFPKNFNPSNIGSAVIQLVSDLLLVLIIMEVLGTVTHYLKERATSLRPFLFIGIISATRGILSIGARLSLGTADNFQHEMIELGVDAAVILALGITIKLLGRHVSDHP